MPASTFWRPIHKAEENDSHQLSGTRPALRSNLPDFDLARDRAAAPFRNFAPIRPRRETVRDRQAGTWNVCNLVGHGGDHAARRLGPRRAHRRAGPRSVPRRNRTTLQPAGAGRCGRGGRCRDAADLARRGSIAADRGSGTRGAHHARAHSPSRESHRKRRRRPCPDWSCELMGRCPAAGLSRPQRLSASSARSQRP